MKRMAYLFLIVFTLPACDPQGDFHYIVDNQSSVELLVEYRFNFDTLANQFIIDAGETKEVFMLETLAGLNDSGDNFLTKFFDSFTVSVDSSLELTKDCQLRDNWDYEAKKSSGTRRSGDNIYTFMVTDDDIQ